MGHIDLGGSIAVHPRLEPALGGLPRRALLGGALAGGVLLLTACAPERITGQPTASPSPRPVVPMVSTMTPSTGSLTGGTSVTIEGSGLSGITGVLFGSQSGTGLTVQGDSRLTVVAPSSVDYAQGPVAVQLLDAKGKPVDVVQQFTFAAITGVDKQMLYAFTYWQNYNTAEWGRFGSDDCGNFVNQTLVARGWTMTPAWYSTYAKNGGYSLSWVRGTPMFDYLNSRSDVTHYTVDQRENVKVGDVVMFDWDPKNGNGVDHTMVVSQVNRAADGTIGIKCVGHTTDYDYRDLDQTITVEYPGATAHFFVIDD